MPRPALTTPRPQAPPLPLAYYLFGQHGGFFIGDRQTLSEAIELLEQAAAQFPEIRYNMDLEGYTLDRLARSAQLGVERALEPIPDRWRLHLTGQARGRRITAEAPADGAQAGLRLNAGEDELALCYQEVPADAGAAGPLTLRVRVRCTRGRAGIGIEAMGPEGPIPGSLREACAPPDGQWHLLEIREYVAPAAAAKIFPHLRLWPAEGGGVGDFADCVCLGAEGRNLLHNADFAQGQTFDDAATLERLRRLARAGRLQVTSSYTQAMMFALDEESLVRQFTWAQQVARETLGLPLAAFATQEPCWTGQMPAVLRGAEVEGAAYANSWAMCGVCPQREGERFDWEGPDGTRLPIAPLNPYARNRASDLWGYWSPCGTPSLLAVGEAQAAGIEHPVFLNLGWDFLPDRVHSPYSTLDAGLQVEFTTIPAYLALARHDGVWPDAFRDFQPRLCWGLWGGEFFRDSRRAADAARLAERLQALFALGPAAAVRPIWDLALLSEHHDPWLCVPSVFGVWMSSYPHYHYTRPPEPTYWGTWPGPYPTFADFIAACRAEAEQRSADLLAADEDAAAVGVFHVLNAAQAARREWLALDFAPPREGEAAWAIVDAEQRAVPARLACEGGRLRGAMLAEVAPFSAATYRVVPATEAPDSPANPPAATCTQRAPGSYLLRNDRLELEVSSESVRLLRGGEPCLRHLHLQARVEDVMARATFSHVEAEATASGTARARLSGTLADIPVTLLLELAPYGRALSISVEADLNGQRMEGERELEFRGRIWKMHEDFSGSLQLRLGWPREACYLAHLPFELREPARPNYWAVGYHLSEWDSGGVCTLLDRSTGIEHTADEIGIVLCHSGEYPLTADTDWPYGFGTALVHGRRTYTVGLLPYQADERLEVLRQAQDHTLPLVVRAGAVPATELPGLHIEGPLLTTGLERAGAGWQLRLWSPGPAGQTRISLPGFEIARCNLLGAAAELLGRDEVQFEVAPMQIVTLALTPR